MPGAVFNQRKRTEKTMKFKSLLLLMATGVMLAFTGCDDDTSTDDSATADDSGAFEAVTIN